VRRRRGRRETRTTEGSPWESSGQDRRGGSFQRARAVPTGQAPIDGAASESGPPPTVEGRSHHTGCALDPQARPSARAPPARVRLGFARRLAGTLGQRRAPRARSTNTALLWTAGASRPREIRLHGLRRASTPRLPSPGMRPLHSLLVAVFV